MLEQVERQESKVVEATLPGGAQHQLALFPPPEEGVAQRLRAADVERLTPLDALNLLAQLKRDLVKKAIGDRRWAIGRRW